MFNQFNPALALLALPALVAAAPVNDLAHVQNHLRAVERMTATFTQPARSGKLLTGVLPL